MLGGGKMRAWIKGAILGFIWSILGFKIATMSFIKPVWFKIITGFPNFIAVKLGFGWWLVFVGGPLVGIVLGALLGFLYEWYKGRNEK